MNWTKPGSKISCARSFDVPNPFIPRRHFTVKAGRDAIVVSIGPGDHVSEDGKPVSVTNVGVDDIVIGWFDFGTGSRSGYISLTPEQFEQLWVSKSAQALKSRALRPMIVSEHPDKRGRDKPHIGYWAASPDPEADEFFQKGVELPWPGDFISDAWVGTVREVLLEHLRAGSVVESWRGSSKCRLCGIRGNGYRDLSDGVYVWPEGLAHYVEAHNVKPPQEFLRHVYAMKGIITGCFGDI